jgi:hypothetical protein
MDVTEEPDAAGPDGGPVCADGYRLSQGECRPEDGPGSGGDGGSGCAQSAGVRQAGSTALAMLLCLLALLAVKRRPSLGRCESRNGAGCRETLPCLDGARKPE